MSDIDKKTKFLLGVLAVFVVGIFVFGVNTEAQEVTGKQIDLSAYIVNDKNEEIPNGDYSVRFAIYTIDREEQDPYPSDSDSGSRAWEEEQEVQIINGSFSVYLGSVTPIPETLNFEDTDYYLGIRVNGDGEAVPRKKIGYVPLAMNANYLRGAKVGTEEGDILQLGNGGKIDIDLLPIGDGDNEILTGNSNNLHDQNTDEGTDSETFNIGSDTSSSGNNFDLTVSSDTNKPTIRFNGTSQAWEFSDDGSTFSELGGLGFSGTSGSVVFANSSGLTEDNSNFYWDDANNRLGLGTSSPGARLAVNGDAFIGSATNTFDPIAQASTTTVDSSYDSGRNSSLVLGSDGFPRISYFFNDGEGTYRLMYAQCEDAQCSAVNTAIVDPSARSTSDRYTSSIKIGSDGFAHIAYFDDNTDSLKYAQCNDDACSSPTLTTIDSDPSRRVGSGADMVLDNSGNPNITYMIGGTGDGNGGNLELARYVGGGFGVGCADTSDWTCSTVDSTGGKRTTVKLGQDGFLRIADFYSNSTPNESAVRFIKCNNTDCSSSTVNEVFSYTANDNYDLSMALGQDGFGRIAFQDQPNDDLVFVQCLNDECSSIANGAPTMIDDSTSWTGMNTSIQIGSDGFARISYEDDDDEDLEYAVCENDDCSSVTITTLDSDVDYGDYSTSLALTADDSYMISYYDETNDDLKFAYESNYEFDPDGDDLLVLGDVAVGNDILLKGDLRIEGGINQHSSDANNLIGDLNVVGNINTDGSYQIGGNDIIKFGDRSIFVGVSSGFTDTGSNGYRNTALGEETLYYNEWGGDNTAIGYRSLYGQSGGSHYYNTAIGSYSMYNNYSGQSNVASGHYALYSNYSGHYNVASGYQSLYNNYSGGSNSAYGYQSLYNNYNGSYNTATGYHALMNNYSGNYNLANGYQAAYSNYSGSYNVSDGYRALYRNYSGNDNVALGREALYSGSSSSGSYNFAAGYRSLYNNYNGNYNIANGAYSLYANYSGGGNIASGQNSLRNNYSGSYNIASGLQALYNNYSGSNNIANGNAALYANYNGSYNTANGYYALNRNYSGLYNVGIGYYAGYGAGSSYGSSNVAIGSYGLYSNYSGDHNIAFGHQSLYSNYSGSYNTGLGYRALYANNSGSGNIGIGYQAGDNLTSGTGNIIIGYSIDAPSTTSSYQLSIGNLIYGTNLSGSGLSVSPGNIGIGINNPSQRLHVSGNLRLTGAFYDSSNETGTLGQVLSSTATGTDWIDSGINPLMYRVDGYTSFIGGIGTGGPGGSLVTKRITDEGNLINIGSIEAGKTHLTNAGTFAAKTDYVAGSRPRDVAIGDFNNDGANDLVVPDYFADLISIFINNGDGTFAAKADYATGSGPYAVSVGDLNGDGSIDIAAANKNSDSVSIFVNNGDGTFAAKVDYGTYSDPNSVSMGDLNGDGKPDLALSNWNTVSILINNGNGTFAAVSSVGAGSSPAGVSIGDLNGDGDGDLVVSNTGDDDISVLMGNGDGTFAAKTDYVTGLGPSHLSIGDLSGDENSDIVVSNQGFGSFDFSVFINNGDGTFAAKVDYATGAMRPSDVAIGDFNGDGSGDVVILEPTATNIVSIYINNGDGTFGSPLSYATGDGPTGVSVGDLNNDNKVDIATSNYNDDSVSVFLNQPQTMFYADASNGLVGIGTSTLTSGAQLTVDGLLSQIGLGNSTYFGYQAGQNDDLSNNNNAGFGNEALYSNVGGQDNTASGYRSLYSNDSGSYNTANGYEALYTNTTGAQNVALGYRSLYSSDSGDYNVAVGLGSLFNATGNTNVALGHLAGDNITIGNNNIVIGYDVDAPVATGSSQLSIGNLIFGSGGFGIGTSIGSGNIGIALNNPTARLHLAAGTATTNTAPLKLTAGTNLTTPEAGAIEFDGTNLYYTDSTLTRNTISTGGALTPSAIWDTDLDTGVEVERTADDDIIRFRAAGTQYFSIDGPRLNVQSSGYSVFIGGSGAGANDDLSNNSNVGIGESALNVNVTGEQNTAVGLWAMVNGSGSYNTAIGALANPRGDSNVAVGNNSLYGGFTSNTVAIGNGAGYGLDGDNNILLGYQAGNNLTTGANNIVIGYDIDSPTATNSNTMTIGNLMFGTGLDGTGTTISSGAIGVGTNSPTAGSRLTVSGLVSQIGLGESTYFGEGAGTNDDLAVRENVGIGYRSLYSNTSGFRNMGIGSQTLYSNTTGWGNVASGHSSLYNNTSGRNNLAYGSFSLYSNTTGIHNTIIGHFSQYNGTGTTENTALGYTSLYSNSGHRNTALGVDTLYSNAGNDNIAIGYSTGSTSITGSKNILIGHNVDIQSAANSNTLSIGNLIFGTGLDGTGTTISSGNIGIGVVPSNFKIELAGHVGPSVDDTYDLGSSTYRWRDLYLGPASLHIGVDGDEAIISYDTVNNLLNIDKNVVFSGTISQTSLGRSTYFGYQAGENDDLSDNENTGIGYQSLYSNQTGYSNTATGFESLYSNTSGISNTATGYYSLWANTTGEENVAVGIASLYQNITGSYNTAIGTDAMFRGSAGLNSVAVGYQALYGAAGASGGGNNVAVGYQSLYKNDDSIDNVAIGREALYSNTSGDFNIGVGMYSLWSVTTGVGNVAVGYDANSWGTGNYNTSLGHEALRLTTGSSNIGIGAEAGENITSGSDNVIIGNHISAPSATGSNQMSIGNLIYGTGVDGTGTTISSGNIGIGINNPSQKLHISGNLRLTGAFYDSNNDPGSIGQVLSSTVTGTSWIDAPSSLNPLAFNINGYTSFLGGVGTGGMHGSIRINNDGNLVNIGSIYAGETHLTSAGTFATKVDYATPTNGSYGAISADFDKDGDVDIVVANGFANSISVFINNGDGTFAAKVDYSTSGTALYLDKGDFDGDGSLDVAVTDSGSSGVRIFINNGDGTFAAGVSYGLGAAVNSVAVGDFNNDGDPDFAATHGFTNDLVGVFINDGDGTFTFNANYTTGANPRGVAAGDLDNDGNIDLAVNDNSGNVSVLLNNGDGTFAAKVDYAVGSAPMKVTIGDFDRDNWNDIATANNGAASMSILINNGDGTFATKVDYTTGTSPYEIIADDLDGDGYGDIAVVNDGSNNASVLINNGDGTFAAKVDYTTGLAPRGVSTGDFNGDGKKDIVSVNYTSDSISILMNQPQTMLYADASNGYIGIGTNTPGYLLTVNGQPAANGYTAFTNYSDQRLKENINPLGAGYLDKIMQLNPSSFNYNELSGYDAETRSRTINGFIAQELQTIFPEMVGQVNIDGTDYYDTNLSALPIYLTKAIQEQQIVIEGQDLEIDGVTLQTNQNITTLTELQASIDDNLLTISDELIDQKERLTSLELELQGVDLDLMNTQIDELMSFMLAMETDMFVKLNSVAIGNILLDGKLESSTLETGAVVVKVIDSASATIGEATICPEGDYYNEDLEICEAAVDEDADGLDDATDSVVSDGKSVVVKTTAVGENSKVFVTLKGSSKIVPLKVSSILDGESFEIEAGEILTENAKIDWWIVEETVATQ